MLHTMFRPPLAVLDIGGGDDIVERAGYVDKQAQLSALMQSGEALRAYQERLYPAKEYPPNPEYDPTIQKGYDFFDAHEDVVFVRHTLSNLERSFSTKEAQATLRAATVVAAGPVRLDNIGPVTPDNGGTPSPTPNA